MKKFAIGVIKILCPLALCVSTCTYAQTASSDNILNEQALQQLRSLQALSGPGGGAPAPARPQATAPAAPTGVVSQGVLPKTPEELAKGGDEAVDEAAFRSVLRDKFPLTPEQILRLRQAYEKVKMAENASPGTPPRPVATSKIVNLAPGSTPPVIRLAQGFVSSMVFLDSSGAPWPIASYDLGNPDAFNIQWDKTSNTLMIQASKLYTYGNLAVRLRDLNTPVMITLIPGQKAVDYRVDLRVQGYGPEAKALPTGDNLPAHASSLLLSILDGVAPNSATELTVSGGVAQVWALANRMYVRTRLTILSPGWISTMKSADGTHAYEMNISPVLLVSANGKIKQLRIEGL